MHIFTSELVPSLPGRKGGDFVDQCATKAKLAVQDLGFALDQGVLDVERLLSDG